MIILHLIKFGERKVTNKKLKIVIPEDLNYEDVFDDIFLKYTQSNQLIKVKTTDLGSLYELEYMVRMNSSLKDKDFIDELRCRNGNLNIVLSLAEI